MEQYIVIARDKTTKDHYYYHIDARDDDRANERATEIVNAIDYVESDYSLFKKIQ